MSLLQKYLSYETPQSLNLTHRAMDWIEAVHWYDSALKMTDYDEGGEFDGMQDEPRYLLLARLAEMYQEGGNNLDADPQRAGERISGCSHEHPTH